MRDKPIPRLLGALACALALGLVLLGCSTSKKNHTHDAGKADSGSAAVGKLERPGTLPRPPAGRLPDELRPPR